jgi:hypothetical protein
MTLSHSFRGVTAALATSLLAAAFFSGPARASAPQQKTQAP